jgi:hypothetical protein
MKSRDRREQGQTSRLSPRRDVKHDAGGRRETICLQQSHAGGRELPVASPYVISLVEHIEAARLGITQNLVVHAPPRYARRARDHPGLRIAIDRRPPAFPRFDGCKIGRRQGASKAQMLAGALLGK